MNTYTEKQISSALRNGRKVSVIQPSRDYSRSNNGGEYEYQARYTYRQGVVTKKFWTSCDFSEYCPNCGRFTSHAEWDKCDPRTIEFNKAVSEIVNAQGCSPVVNTDGITIFDYVMIEGL